jgi:hypothetical protein
MSGWRRKGLFALGAFTLAFAGFFSAVGPLVRSRIDAFALRYHARVHVGSIRPGFLVLRLRDVTVTLEDVAGFDVALAEVEVTVSAGLTPKRVVARNGNIEVRDLEALRKHFSARAAHDAAAETPAPSSLEEVRAEGLSFRISEASSSVNAEGSGLSVVRNADDVAIMVKTASVSHGAYSAEVGGLDVLALRTPALELKRAHAESVHLHLPPGTPRTPDAKPEDDAREGIDLEARLRSASNMVRAAAGVACEKLPEAVPLSTSSFHVAFQKQGAAEMGQGPFTVSKQSGTLAFTFESEAREGTTPIKLRVSAPCDAASKSDVVVHLEGGPAPLALAGIREGTFGISDVEKATVTGDGDLRIGDAAISIDGRAKLSDLGFTEPKIAKEPMHGMNLALVLRGVFTEGRALRIDDFDIGVGAAHMTVHGTATSKATPGKAKFDLENYVADLAFEIPVASCDSMLESLPKSLAPTLQGAHMAGTFGARGRFAFDGKKLGELTLDYLIRDDCRMTAVPPHLEKRRFASAFQHVIYHPDGSKAEETTGPGTEGWTEFENISPFMQAAVLTTEDGGFRHHHGFSHGAIKSALINNLKARKFVQGASTISMQLTKNLLLSREKTLSRKFEEIVLTDYLEQVFDKDEMMELYLNIIEFGPNIYGIRKAASHYFGRSPGELNLAECMFLATLLPAPVKLSHMGDRSEISPGWQSYIERLMKTALKTGKVTASELESGLASAHLMFHQPGSAKPAPRPPARGTRAEGNDNEWVPIDAPL